MEHVEFKLPLELLSGFELVKVLNEGVKLVKRKGTGRNEWNVLVSWWGNSAAWTEGGKVLW